MFEQGTREKLRFSTSRGAITIEDLWDLPLLSTTQAPCLDDLARGLHRELKASEEESFVLPHNATNTVLELKLGVVKRIIEVKLAEAEAREQAAERKLKKERLLSVIAEKEDDKLKKTSLTDLKKMVREL